MDQPTLRRRLLSAEPFKVCYPADPAINWDKSDRHQYLTTRDPDLVQTKEGDAIQWYSVRRLTRDEIMHIDTTSASDKIALIRAFRLGVVQVDNLRRNDESVEGTWVPGYLASPESNKSRMISSEEMELFPLPEVYDIGMVVVSRALLAPRRPVFFPPPPSSALDMAVASYLSAADTQTDASPDSESSPSQPTTISAESGEALGDVIVKDPSS